jgi:hypothetical protein
LSDDVSQNNARCQSQRRNAVKAGITGAGGKSEAAAEWYYFSDADWTNAAARFYRVRVE